jgi:hypothetical protein
MLQTKKTEKVMPTLKQEKVLEKLPENDFNLAKAMREVGYSESTCRGGQARLAIRKYTKGKYFDHDWIMRELKKALKTCKSEKDRTNTLRAIELISKIEGLQIDKQETNKVPDNIIINTQPKPSDNKDIQQESKLT